MNKKQFNIICDKMQGILSEPVKFVPNRKYLCNAYIIVKKDLYSFYYTTDKLRNREPFVKELIKFFKKRNDTNSGIFGCIGNPENVEKRKIALELFRQYCIENKLYEKF